MIRILALLALAACTAPAAQPLPPGHETAQLARIEASVDLDGHRIGHAAGPTLVVVFASWCQHCHKELAQLAELRAAEPSLRVLGLNYKGHEEYDGRGSSSAVRAYVATHAPWLRVVPADDALFGMIGRPPIVPTLYLYNRGKLVALFDRRERPMPDARELRKLLARIDG